MSSFPSWQGFAFHGRHFFVTELSAYITIYASKCFMIVSISPIGLRYLSLAFWMISFGDYINSSLRTACLMISCLLLPKCLGMSFSLIF